MWEKPYQKLTAASFQLDLCRPSIPMDPDTWANVSAEQAESVASRAEFADLQRYDAFGHVQWKTIWKKKKKKKKKWHKRHKYVQITIDKQIMYEN